MLVARANSAIRSLSSSLTPEPPPTQYVSGGSVHLAYQTYGKGRIDILMLPGFVSHVERVWEDERCRAFLSSLAAMGRLVLFDRRGVGQSDRVGFSPSAGGNRAGHPHRSRCRRLAPGRAVWRIRRRTGLHHLRGSALPG